MRFNGLIRERVPGSVEEARTLIAYNERILHTSGSPQRRQRAEAMLVNLRPECDRLERDEVDRLARIHAVQPPRRVVEDDQFDVVFSGGQEGLSSYQQGKNRATHL